MTQPAPSLLLLIPAYNEENRIEPVLAEFAEYFQQHYPGKFQLVVVLNGCRDVLRRRSRKIPAALLEPNAASAESHVLLAEEHREVLAALRQLPGRQREAVVLRHCLGLPEDEVAQAMGVSRGTVKSSAHRGLAALARILKEAP